MPIFTSPNLFYYEKEDCKEGQSTENKKQWNNDGSHVFSVVEE